jgi:D-alanyl-D-alanine carboxypeptidase
MAAALVIGSQAMLFGDQALGQSAKALPKVTATSVFVMDADTGQVLYAKNPDKVFRILSLTKLVTAYILVDHLRTSLGFLCAQLGSGLLLAKPR